MSGSGSSGKLAIIGLFGIAVVGVGVFALTRGGGGNGEGGSSDPGAGTGKGEPVAKGDVVDIEFVYSTEKKAWVEESVAAFQAANPGIRVKLTGKGSLIAVGEILDGKLQPTVWSPADTAALNLLADDWYLKQRVKVFAESGDLAPLPLVVTPLVFVAWQSRGDALTGGGEQPVTWQRLYEAVAAPKGWAAVGGSAEWGPVKLGHTDPTKSNSGLQALILMTYAHLGKSSGLQVSDLGNADLHAFIKGIEKGVTKFGTSTGTFMTDMVLYGPSKYDIVVAYENLAIEQIPNARGRWEELRVYYPQQTMWSSHPGAVLDAPWVTPQQRDAGRKLLAFLRSPDAQRGALRYGFRPADTSIPILGDQADNPFAGAEAFGVKIDIPAVAEPPPGPVINNLMVTWTRIVGS